MSVIMIILLFQSTFATECDLAFLKSQCEVLRKEKGVKLKVGGVEYYNPAKAKVKGDTVLLSPQQQQSKFNEMYAFVKKTILEEILQGRKLEDLPPAQRQMYDRLNTVKPGGIVNASCGTNPGGLYDRATHSISLCPGVFNYPESVGVGILAHEIAHAIDPCSAVLPVFELDAQKALAFHGSDAYRAEVAPNNDREMLLADIYNSGGMGSLWQWSQIERSHFQYMAQKEFIKDVPIKPTARDEYPFQSTITCLQGKGVIEVTDEKYKEFLRSAPIPTSEARTRMEKHARHAPHCPLRIKGQRAPMSQMPEMLCDLWKAKITAKYLGKTPSAEEARASMASELFGVCQPDLFGGREKTDGFGTTKHPSWEVRVLHSMLREPKIAQALGCQIPKGDNCVLKLTEDLKANTTTVPPVRTER